MTIHQEYIAPAQLSWLDGQPVSADFNDIYFSADAQQEGQRVLIQPSELIQRAEQSTEKCFTIGELGFGSGLNFFVCADELVQNTDKILHFISIEAYPLSHEDWRHVLAKLPNSPTAEALIQSPPPLLTGWHRRSLLQGRVQLSLFHGDVKAGVKELEQWQRQPVNAWFLDGFAPDKNPAMWQQDIFTTLANLSDVGTTVTTFTSAGQVRRDLQAVGFAMEKVDQRPFKRSSLLGRLTQSSRRDRVAPPHHINVLGAGIAGASVARQLAELGLQVTVFDPAGIASGGSKMNVSAMHARLLGDRTPAAEFRARAFHHARAVHQQYAAFQHTGALQLALNERDLGKLKRIYAAYQPPGTQANADPWLDYRTASNLKDLTPVEALGGLYFPGAGLVDLPLLCQTLLDHSNIEFHGRSQEPRQHEPWIIACGSASRDFSLGLPLEIGNVWGQLDWIKPTDANLPVPIVGNGYAIPAGDLWVVGSSYEHRPWQPEEASASNIEANRRFVGDVDVVSLAHKRAPRCVSSDRDPVIGRVGEQRWVSAAHGSGGTSAAPLAASIIASDIMGWVPPISPRALTSVAPDRFVQRQIKRGVKVVGPPQI